MRLRAGGPDRGVRLARSAEGRRLRFFRQSQPSQAQTAVAGCDLRRTRQFGPPRAFGGLGPAVHYIRRHCTLSVRGQRAASQCGNASGATVPSSLLMPCCGMQEEDPLRSRFCGELLCWYQRSCHINHWKSMIHRLEACLGGAIRVAIGPEIGVLRRDGQRAAEPRRDGGGSGAEWRAQEASFPAG